MKRRHLLLPIPILAVLVAAGALYVTREDGSSGGSAEAAAQVAAAFVKVQELKSVTMRQTSVTVGGGDYLRFEQVMTIELPDRFHVTTSANGQTSEAYIVGEQVFVRKQELLPWDTMNLRDLGIDPEAMYSTDQLAFLPEELVILGEVTESGVTMIHYRAKIDGDELVDLLAEVFLENSAIRRALERVKVDEMEAEYFIGKDDQLPYRAFVKLKIIEGGREFQSISEAEYFDFNAPLVLPEDLPLTP